MRLSGNDGTTVSNALSVVASANPVCGTAPTVSATSTGSWTPDAGFIGGDDPANAIQLTVDLDGISPLWGSWLPAGTLSFGATATAAALPLELMVVYDASPSWSESAAMDARDAFVGLIDALGPTVSPEDTAGFVAVHSRYATVMDGVTSIATLFDQSTLTTAWNDRILGSRAGSNGTIDDGTNCTVHTGGSLDDFSSPAGGCYPDMPRVYSDEFGLHPGRGLRSALEQFQTSGSTGTVFVVIYLTDTPFSASSIPANAGDARAADGYTETRFVQVDAVAAPTDLATVLTETVNDADAIGTQGGHLWVLTFNTSDGAFDALPQGLGWREEVASSADLPTAMTQILAALPVGVVE